MDIFDFLIRVGAAVGLGAVIGIERDLRGHVAGIRTNMLVGLGACLFTSFSVLVGQGDATRVAAQVVTGIGFLCGGVIFKEGLNVRGLNTAATIWCTAAVGVLTAAGFLLQAVFATAVLLVCTTLFRLIARLLEPFTRYDIDDDETQYQISITCLEEQEFAIREIMMNAIERRRSALRLTHLESADEIGGKVEIEATIQAGGRRADRDLEQLTNGIALAPGVTKSGWEII